MKILNISSLNRDNTTALINKDSLFSNKSLGLNNYTDTTSGQINNLNTLDKSAIKLTQATNLTGLASGEDGKLVVIHNDNSSNLRIKNLSSDSSSINRIVTGTNGDLTVLPDASILLQYDGDDTLWRVVGGSGSSEYNLTDIKTANYTAANLDVVLCDTTSSSFTVTLPSTPLNNNYVSILDIGSNFGNNNLIISSAKNIQNINDTWAIDINNAYIELTFSELADSWFFKEIPGVFNGVSYSNNKTVHTQNITQNDLDTFGNGKKISITHNINVEYPIVQVYDNNKFQIIPTEVKSTGIDSIELDLDGYTPITGIWRIRVI